MTYDLKQSGSGEGGSPGERPAAPPSIDPRVQEAKKSARLVSLDAYRGFVMLAMAVSGFAIADTLTEHPEILEQYNDTSYGDAWRSLWQALAYQFSHVPWTGCSFWDLIQPSFMFMVGVAMPYSYSRRSLMGQSTPRRFGHVAARSLVLVFLGVFLSSQRSGFVNFTFVNVLTQIGLGYTVLYLFLGQRFSVQLAGAALILGGYWFYFYRHEIPAAEKQQLTEYLEARVLPSIRSRDLPEFEKERLIEIETGLFEGLPGHWNKHTNAAAAFDRRVLNWFPRDEEPFQGQAFWINSGGYQTLNFVPSIVTMLFGLMAGQLLRSGRRPGEIFKRLLTGGLLCFVAAMAVDTTIWPVQIAGLDWSLCPAVKRIWTPTWAVFSSGWCLWMLGMFYWVIDIQGAKRWAFPLQVVGMNSIAFYCMSQLIKPWAGRMLEIWLRTLEEISGRLAGFDWSLSYFIFSDEYAYSRIWETVARVFVLWLIALWLYRRKIFIRI